MFQSGLDIVPAPVLEILKRRQSGGLEVLTKVGGQGLMVSDNPSFHASGHQQHLIVSGALRLEPAVSIQEVGPGLVYVRHRVLAIYQQCNVVGSGRIGMGGLEVVIG